MTAREVAELHDLGRTPEEIASRTREIDAKLAAERLAKERLHVTGSGHDRGISEEEYFAGVVRIESAKPARAPRKDKGVPRKPKTVEQPAASAGVLTTEQVSRIFDLNDSVEMALVREAEHLARHADAVEHRKSMERQRKAYLDSLTGAGGK